MTELNYKLDERNNLLKHIQVTSISNYGEYSSDNYGINTMTVFDAQGRQIWFSYDTVIAVRTRKHGLVIRKNSWGPTTGKHMNFIYPTDNKHRMDNYEFIKVLNEEFGTPAKVIIEVRDGVAEVTQKPMGIVLEIRDFDIQDDDEDYPEIDGEPYAEHIYEADTLLHS